MRKRIKKVQKQANRVIRKLNNNLKEDWLWNGRFYCRQIKANDYTFADNSGGLYSITIKFYDRDKPLVTMIKNYRIIHDTKGSTQKYYSGFNGNLFMDMNHFITEISNVWDEDPNPYKKARSEGRTPDD